MGPGFTTGGTKAVTSLAGPQLAPVRLLATRARERGGLLKPSWTLRNPLSLGRAQPLSSSPLTPELGLCYFICEGRNEKGTGCLLGHRLGHVLSRCAPGAVWPFKC